MQEGRVQFNHMLNYDELVIKYNVSGPRYTSYPSSPFWIQSPTQEEWIQSLNQAFISDQSQGAALYIHIPFCQSLCSYCGCHKRITRKHEVSKPYLETLLLEWQLYQSQLNRKIVLKEIHLGGGTPTFLSPDELRFLVEGLMTNTTLTDDYEFSVEADPRVTSEDHLKTLFQLGFKRLSLGVQDFDPKVQKAIHRVQSERQIEALTELARQIGFTSVNYDLIYGLPFQTTGSMERTIESVLRLRPDRIAFYSYAHVPWIKPAQRRFTEADLPHSVKKRELYELGRKAFESNQYREIGMDHFSLETDSLWKATQEGSLHRNFMGYLHRQVSPLMGLGVSSIGDSWVSFAQNEKQLEVYEKRVRQGELPIARGHLLSPEDEVLRRHILNLMTQMKTSWDASFQSISNFRDIFSALEALQEDGIIELTSSSCRVTQRGVPFLRNVCMAFDVYLIKKGSQANVFSKTI